MGPCCMLRSLVRLLHFMDGTKRTAFLSAIYFLENLGYTIPERLSKAEVIRFCLEIAEENIRRAEDASVQPKTVGEIADWFRRLLGVEDEA